MKKLLWKCGACRNWTPDSANGRLTTRCAHCNLPRPDVVEYRRATSEPTGNPNARRDPVAGVVLILLGLLVVGIAGNWGLALGLMLILIGREIAR